VYIEDNNSAWKGKNCESHTDPHMKTLDGKYYECQLDGTFILYRNEIFQQEVQEKHHMCHPARSYPRCTCAVAVRSGKDVFIVDICGTQTVINFPSCEDKVLKVIKATDKHYKVIFPTGTLVEITFVSWPNWNDWHLNIDIFPSPSDVGNSSGLCGILDNDYKNDFTWNDANKTEDNPDNFNYWNPPNGFSKSWKVQNDEVDLFDTNVYGGLKSITTVFDRTCTCKKNANNPHDGDIICSYGNYKNCNFAVGKRYYCILNPEGQLRRKRDLRHLQSLTAGDPRNNEIHAKSRMKRQTNTDVMSYENATTICNEAFEASASYLMCQEHVSDLANTSLINCVSDLMMTGDVNITKIHIEAALEQCSTFVVLNATFQETEPEITYRIESLCENNCSGNGVCNSGNCTCNSGYAGSDCSFDLSGPPSITHISDFGFCDKSSEACEEITLYGKYFLENMNTTCYIRRKMLAEDGAVLSEINYESGLQERTLFEGYCPLDYNTDVHWVSVFRFNVSNDGSRYTENYNVYTYQSLCQELKNDTGNITFIFKDGYCYINNTCVAAGDTNKDNLCDICDTESNKYQWSFNAGHCFIDGQCYTNGAINGTNPCSVCNPSINITSWSPNPGFCFIDNICYSDGQVNPSKSCDICQSNISRTVWTFNEGYCFIDGLCVKSGDADAIMDCKICNSSISTTQWQLKKDFCLINDGCFVDGGTNSLYPCHHCNVSSNQLSWSKNHEYCEIDNQCLADGQKNVTNDCYYCNASLGQSTWSLSPGYCFIDGLCVKSGDADAIMDCKICNSSISTTQWQLKKDFCLINDGCFVDGGTNSLYPCHHCNVSSNQLSWSKNHEYCEIDNQCLADGQKNVTNDCYYCNASLGQSTWSLSPGYCFIDGLCVKSGDADAIMDCKICNSSISTSQWQLKKDYCLINDGCFVDGGTNSSYPCHHCNVSSNQLSWSKNPEYCEIDNQCLADGQKNVTNDCYYCNASLGQSTWSLSPGYCFIDGLCVKSGDADAIMDCKICNSSISTTQWQLKK
ncbi:uncharacterized protein LOC134265508, partial [Saccostrea cucullata]|uniref:uncharacterized protein LOC134265508 n=1 Tax=Saccostrea cuccullata TaxID=36930 RepID=UPI002ED5D4FE